MSRFSCSLNVFRSDTGDYRRKLHVHENIKVAAEHRLLIYTNKIFNLYTKAYFKNIFDIFNNIEYDPFSFTATISDML